MSDIDLSGIYQIRNLVNGHIYIGSAECFRDRWINHSSNLRRNDHDNIHLQRAWNLYGEENFIFEILLLCPKELLIWYEQQFIDQCNPEYNICKIAGSTKGYHHTTEAKEKMSTNRLGKKHPNSKGHPHSEETRIKLKRSAEKRWERERDNNNKTCNSGENNKQSKLTEEIVKYILKASKEGITERELSKMFGVHIQTISRVIRRVSWKHVTL